jgi:general stress protein 26
MNTGLDTFGGLIDEIKIAMMTTRRPDGHLESRAMAIRDEPTALICGL